MILQHKNLNINQQQNNRAGLTALHFASRNGHIEIVKLLLNQTDIDVNIKAEDGKTPLKLASDNVKSVQAKESTSISEEILQKVCKKCSEQRIKPEDLTPKKVKEILKACKLRKYYNNSVLIYTLLTGVEAPRFKPEVEGHMEIMKLLKEKTTNEKK